MMSTDQKTLLHFFTLVSRDLHNFFFSFSMSFSTFLSKLISLLLKGKQADDQVESTWIHWKIDSERKKHGFIHSFIIQTFHPLVNKIWHHFPMMMLCCLPFFSSSTYIYPGYFRNTSFPYSQSDIERGKILKRKLSLNFCCSFLFINYMLGPPFLTVRKFV